MGFVELVAVISSGCSALEVRMCNPVPVFEAKNRLPFYIHLAETDGLVPIARRNDVVAYIISSDEFEAMQSKGEKKKSLVERIHDSRADFGLTDDDDFDYTEYFDSLRLRNYFGRPEGDHVFDEV